MSQEYPFLVSEWEWLKLQLRLYSLENRGTLWLTQFSFNEEKQANFETARHKIICRIYNGSINEILKEAVTKEQLQQEYFSGWVEMVKEGIEVILNGLPILKEQINLETDIRFEIMKYNVTSSYLICSVVEDIVSWNPKFSL